MENAKQFHQHHRRRHHPHHWQKFSRTNEAKSTSRLRLCILLLFWVSHAVAIFFDAVIFRGKWRTLFFFFLFVRCSLFCLHFMLEPKPRNLTMLFRLFVFRNGTSKPSAFHCSQRCARIKLWRKRKVKYLFFLDFFFFFVFIFVWFRDSAMILLFGFCSIFQWFSCLREFVTLFVFERMKTQKVNEKFCT